MEQSQHKQQKSRLGTLLIHRGLISRKQLDEALTLQAQSGERLGEVLINKGWLTEKQLNKALRRQSRVRLIAAIGAFLLVLCNLLWPTLMQLMTVSSANSILSVAASKS